MEDNSVNAFAVEDDTKAMRSVDQERFECLLEDVDFLFHEIRTPLTVVIHYSEFLRNPELSVDEQRRLLDIISKEAQRIDNLINDFSQSCHHATGTWLAETTFSTIRVSDLLRDAIARFQSASSRHHIRVDIPAELPPVRGDREKLYLVLRNLLANAIKYSPDGGDIFVAATENGQEVTISVRDQGIGIPEECLQQIFSRGYRVNVAGGEKPRGSGLGLAMVKSIIEGHNGRICVESVQGQGGTFSLSLPRVG